jgi:hypothetical protein
VKRMQHVNDPNLLAGATLGTMGGGILKNEFPMPSADINDQKGTWPQYSYPPPEQEIAVPTRSSAVHAENMDQNIIGRFFSSMSSIVEIPSPKVDESQAAQVFWIPEANTPGNYGRVISKRTLIPYRVNRVFPSNLNPTSHPLQALSPEAGPGQQGIDGFVTPRSFHKVEQWLGRMNNPQPQRNPPHTDKQSATSHGRKIQDQLQAHRPGKINISKNTLPPEATDAFTRDKLSVCSESHMTWARPRGGKVLSDAAEKKVSFQGQSNISQEQTLSLRAGCDWVGRDSSLFSAPSLDVRSDSCLAASVRLHECKYEEAVTTAVKTAQLAAAAAATRRTSKVEAFTPSGAWGLVEEGTFVTL